jgi:hypothetical protein
MEISEQEKNNDFPTAYRRMYEVSGQDAITRHSFERYLRDKENILKDIKEKDIDPAIAYQRKIENTPRGKRARLIEDGIMGKDAKIQETCVSMLLYAPDEKIAHLIDIALEIDNAETQGVCAWAIDYAPETSQPPLREKLTAIVEKGLQNINPETQEKYAWMIPHVAKDDKMSSLISIGLQSGIPAVQKACMRAIEESPVSDQTLLREEVASIVEKGLESDISSMWKEYASMAEYVPKEQRETFQGQVISLIRTGLASGDEKIQRECAFMIRYLPSDKMSSFISVGFESNNAEVMKECASMIQNIPPEEIHILAEKGLATGNAEVQKECISAVEHALVDKRASLLKRGFATGNAEVQKICASLLWYVSDEERSDLKKLIPPIVEQGFKAGDAESREVFASMIWYASDDDKAPLIEKGLRSGNVDVQKICAMLIQYVPTEKKKELLEIAKREAEQYLIESPLYADKNISDEHFSRQKFEKSGSELVLIGGKLKDNTIHHRIELEPFLAWQKLYEDFELWKKEGFDYVPVEPIRSFRMNKKGSVDVYSGVLDLSLAEWLRMGGDFSEELKEEMEAIKEISDKNDVFHGHPHKSNFCLRFWRDGKGNVDFSRKPRIYMIDFDQAESPET